MGLESPSWKQSWPRRFRPRVQSLLPARSTPSRALAASTPTPWTPPPTDGEKSPAPQIAVHLSEQARRRAATLNVQALNEYQSERARETASFDGEASVIQRTPGIMTYKRDATPVYTRDLINIRPQASARSQAVSL